MEEGWTVAQSFVRWFLSLSHSRTEAIDYDSVLTIAKIMIIFLIYK